MHGLADYMTGATDKASETMLFYFVKKGGEFPLELFKILGTVAIDGSGAKGELQDVTGIAEQSHSKISGAFEKIGSAAVAVGKTMAAGLAVGTAAVGALVKNSIAGYAEYEQLIGGVETLYGASAKSAEEYAEKTGASLEYAQGVFERYTQREQTILDNAAKAYESAGMSANDYMETVNGFAASLTSSLGEYEWQAANYADMIVTDMADNANKMGTSLESIQNAYSGFAKQNYTMLDNLKLGYGGTKEEMERLLRDAEAFEGYEEGAFDISKFADVAEAINIIQRKMGITGTTAAEAAKTIAGSAASMKAAWSNLVTGLGNEDADLSGLIDQFVASADTMLENVMPRIEVILGGITDLIAQLVPKIADKLPELLNTMLPSLIQAAVQLLNGLVAALPTILQVLIEQMPYIVTEIGKGLAAAFPALLATVKTLFQQIWDYISLELLNTGVSFEDAFTKISEAFNTVWEFCKGIWEKTGQPIFDIIKKTLGYFSENSEETSETVSEIFDTLWAVCQEVWESFGQPIFDTIESVLSFLKENWETIMDSLSQLFTTLWDACKTAWDTIGQPIFDIVKSGLDKVKEVFEANMPKILTFFQDAIAGIKDTWENHLKPAFEAIGAFIENVLAPIFDVVFGLIADYVSMAFDYIISLWTNVLKPAFDGICDFVTNVFSGNWEGAWQAIVDTFEKVFGGIKEVAKVPINWVIKYVNKAIDAINGLSFDVPDWVPGIGGEVFGFNLKKIPELAKGGVLERGQVGILEGTGAEAVVPLENNTEWIGKVAAGFNAVSGDNATLERILEVLLDIRNNMSEEFADIIASMSFEVNNREFARLVKAVN